VDLAPTLEAGALLVFQSELPDARDRLGLEPFADLCVEARLPIYGPLGAFLELSGGAAVVRTDSGLTTGTHAVPRARGAAGLTYGF